MLRLDNSDYYSAYRESGGGIIRRNRREDGDEPMGENLLSGNPAGLRLRDQAFQEGRKSRDAVHIGRTTVR